MLRPGATLCWGTMSTATRSLADELRRFDDDRLGALLAARPDLSTPVPHGIGPLAARAASTGSVHRALNSLVLPELEVLEALVVLPDAIAPDQLAAAVGAEVADCAPVLDRLRTLALLWGTEELHLVRSARELVRNPAGLAAVTEEDPSEQQARDLVQAAPSALDSALDALAWGPAHLDGATGSALATELERCGLARRTERKDLVIPRSVHLVLRGGAVRRSLSTERPHPHGQEVAERIPGTRTAEAVETALGALAVLGSVRSWDDDPPSVLRRGGIPQRDARRLAAHADTDPVTYLTVIQTAWCAGLLGHDGQDWHPTRDWDEHRSRPLESRWAELVLAWTESHHLAAIAGTPDPSGTPRAPLSDDTRREGARTRRKVMLRALAAAEGRAVAANELTQVLTWAFPLVPAAALQEEAEALIAEGTALGLLQAGGLSVLGQALVRCLEEDVRSADALLAEALREAAPAPVDEVVLDTDLTILIPGRPSDRLLDLLTWADVLSRGSALTLRVTAASLRRAMAAGNDPADLLALLRATSRSPVPQAMEYLIADERRRHGQVRVGRAHAWLTGDEDVLSRLQASPEAAALALRRIAPTVLVTTSDPGFVLQIVRRSGLSPIAIGPDGRPARVEVDHALHGGPRDTDLDVIDGPDLTVPPAEAVARIRAAEEGEEDLSVTDRLLEAIAHGSSLRIGIVDGRGGVVARDAVPLSLEGGRLRARDARGTEEFTVLVHRVTLG